MPFLSTCLQAKSELHCIRVHLLTWVGGGTGGGSASSGNRSPASSAARWKLWSAVVMPSFLSLCKGSEGARKKLQSTHTCLHFPLFVLDAEGDRIL